MEDFKKFEGNKRGLVVDTKDPRDIGRIKILVYGVYPDDTPHDCLPWAIPALGMYHSGGENMDSMHSADGSPTGYNQTGTGGEFTVPDVGNHVWVFFDNGHHMHPVYWAMAPGEDDWLAQKQYIKDKLDNKLIQIHEFREIFQQEDGTKGFDGVDWADGAYVNARQNITTDGEEGPTAINDKRKGKDSKNNVNDGKDIEVLGGNYATIPLNISKQDANGKSSKNMPDGKRSWQNFVGLDIKPLFDKENIYTNIQDDIDRSSKPHAYDEDWKYDDIDNDKVRDINRNITSKTSANGVTEIFDNTKDQENYYFIHQNYIQNIDQFGSRKIFVGQNTTQQESYRGDDKSGKGPEKQIRCNDELGVAGDKKTHVQGNVVDYTKGNWLIQVDKNTQIDINDSLGIRVKKGDYDIIIEGNDDIGNKRNSGTDDREGPKTKQKGDLNVAIRNGNMEVYTKKNINIHCQGDANLQVDGSMRTYVKQDYHLFVGGDYNEIVEGHKYETVEQNCEFHYNKANSGHVKWLINGEERKNVDKEKHLKVGQARKTQIGAQDSLTATHLGVNNSAHFTGLVSSSVNFRIPNVGLKGHTHPDGELDGTTGAPVNDGGTQPGAQPPLDATNVGGGTTKEQEQSNKTSPTHNGDRTQLAKRDHLLRNEKEKGQQAKTQVPSNKRKYQ